MDADGQLALFDEGGDVELGDLEGLLPAGADLVRRGADARLSIVVTELWRAELIRAALDARDLPGERVEVFDGQLAVRTPFHRSLTPLAERWITGSRTQPPPDWRLGPRRLRLWAIAAGGQDSAGYLLRLGRKGDQGMWSAVGGALIRVGLAGTFLGPRAGGPAFRITGSRRGRRLAMMLGPAPETLPQGCWPAPRG